MTDIQLCKRRYIPNEIVYFKNNKIISYEFNDTPYTLNFDLITQKEVDLGRYTLDKLLTKFYNVNLKMANYISEGWI